MAAAPEELRYTGITFAHDRVVGWKTVNQRGATPRKCVVCRLQSLMEQVIRFRAVIRETVNTVARVVGVQRDNALKLLVTNLRLQEAYPPVPRSFARTGDSNPLRTWSSECRRQVRSGYTSGR